LDEKARGQTSHSLSSRRPEPDISTWLTRWEAAELLGVVEATIINWGRKKRLEPIRGLRADRRGAERAVWLYDPEQLSRMPRSNRGARDARTPGEIAARCFELFREGKTKRDIVIELRQEPERIELLYDKWLDFGGAAHVITKVAQQDFENIVGPFISVADLFDLVRDLAAKAAGQTPQTRS
jgi:hypothetical protein